MESERGEEWEFDHSWLMSCMHFSLLLVRISGKHAHTHLHL